MKNEEWRDDEDAEREMNEAWEEYEESICKEMDEVSAWEFLLEQIRAGDPTQSISEYADQLLEENMITAEQCYYFACLMREIVDEKGQHIYSVEIPNETPQMMMLQRAYMWVYNVDIKNKDAITALIQNLDLMVEREEITPKQRTELMSIVFDRVKG